MEQQREIFETYCRDRYRQREVADGCHPTTSKTVTRQKGERIVKVLKNDPASRGYSPEFKHWIKLQRFQLVPYTALGLKDVLCLPAKFQVMK